MNYISTRQLSEGPRVSSAEAIRAGIAPDGVLYMPESIPSLPAGALSLMQGMDYAGRAAYILKFFLTDYGEAKLAELTRAAYGGGAFGGNPAPVVSLGGGLSVLELFRGPTCAFKDMALQLMPRLLTEALALTGETRSAFILTATSGDTGKAALEGVRDVERLRITVFYPEVGVSAVQKRQMASAGGTNVDVCAVKGNFDDCQSGVKAIFADAGIKRLLGERGYFFSSANSINWGRLAPQIVYYFSAYLDMAASGEIKAGEQIDVCVPTGNFGNIFSAYICKSMGLPIRKLICASNKNHILTDFLANGVYDRNRDFYATMSPSMDILISSNLERLLYLAAGPERASAYMAELAREGRYTVEPEVLGAISRSITGDWLDEGETSAAIKRVWEEYGYLPDTHTAVALGSALKRAQRNDGVKTLVAATASPFKFAQDVLFALRDSRPADEFAAIDKLSGFTGIPIPAPLSGIGSKDVRFTTSVEPSGMRDYIIQSLK